MDKQQVYDILNKAYFSEECHENMIMKHLPSMLRSVNVFVDVGASLGQYTQLANKSIQEGHIYAIEPDPVRFEELQRNCHKWSRLSSNKLTPLNAAVADTQQKVKFFTTNSSTSGGLFKHPTQQKAADWEEIEVDGLSLDTLFIEDGPDFVKIDVEGAELRVLKGATKILRDGNAKFLIELHYWADPEGQRNADEVLCFMKSFGYWPVNYYGKLLFVNSGSLLFKAKLLSPFLRRFYRFKSFVKIKLQKKFM